MKTSRILGFLAGGIATTVTLPAQTNIFPASGNVGIGTTNPAYRLHVEGTSYYPLFYVHTNTAGNNVGSLLNDFAGGAIFGDGPNGNAFQAVNGSNAALLTVRSSGNVGIGTTSPQAALDIPNHTPAGNTVQIGTLGIQSRGVNNGFIQDNAYWSGTGEIYRQNGPISMVQLINGNIMLRAAPTGTAGGTATLATNVMVTNTGNVGIGTASPGAKLHVVGDISLGYWNNGISRFVGISQSDNNFTTAGASIEFTSSSGSNAINFRTHHNGVSAATRMTVDQDGNVGVGTINPTEKLAVNGRIRAKEVIVETNWSDFVFDPGYRLTPLSEVERQIKAERHLPGIPSAHDVAQGGVSLGQMQARLLQKIEELTLHVIAQEKRIQKLEEENRQLRSMR